jgi:hypothetical protein
MFSPLAHLLIVAGVVCCLYAARREQRTGEISIVRLALPVAGVAAVACGLMLVDRPPPPKALLGFALLLGLLVGTARGATVRVKWSTMNRFAVRGRRDLIWLSTILVSALIVRLLDVFLRPHGGTLGFGAGVVAIVCLGIVLSRGALIASRALGRMLA